MNGYNFTERVRTVLAMAREEAARQGREHVAPEHLLLGIVREGDGVAVAVLQNLGVDLDDLRDRIESHDQPGRRDDRPPLDLPYTSQAKKVLELSMREARELNHSYVGTEHLLLGLFRVDGSRVKEVLEKELQLSVEQARAETLRLLGTDVTDGQPSARFRSLENAPMRIAIRVEYPDGRVAEHHCKGRFEALRTIASL